jgi:hypothetical protein
MCKLVVITIGSFSSGIALSFMGIESLKSLSVLIVVA